MVGNVKKKSKEWKGRKAGKKSWEGRKCPESGKRRKSQGKSSWEVKESEGKEIMKR